MVLAVSSDLRALGPLPVCGYAVPAAAGRGGGGAAGAAQARRPRRRHPARRPRRRPGRPPATRRHSPRPLRTPPGGTAPVVRSIELRFHPVNESLIEPQTYLYYIQAQASRPTDGVWVPYTDATEKVLLDDFKRLWATNFLDNLWIEVNDDAYPNGVVGKRVIYHMEERPRVKIVDYTGSTKVERTKVDEKMKELGISLRLDSFLDEGVVRRVKGIVRDLMAEKGYEFAEVNSSVEAAAGRPEAREGGLRRPGRPAGQGPDHQLRGQRSGRRRHPEAPDEVHQGAVVPLLDHRPRQVPGSQVRGGRRPHRRVLPQPRLRAGPRRSAGPARCSKTATTRKPAGCSWTSRWTKVRVSRSASSSSTATPSSSPTSCGRSSS